MKLGIVMFGTGDAISPMDLAVMVEGRGFESLWFSDHTHIPASRETPWPGGGELPREYWHMYDPFVALAAAGASTTRLRLGTGVCLVAQRDPIITAKVTATLDALTNGRFLFGVGVGWNREEMINHGTNPQRRVQKLRECVGAIKEIWAQDNAEYHGEFVNFDPIWSWPKPTQKPGPPVLVGGNTVKTLDRVVAYGDEWMPHRVDTEQLGPLIDDLQRRAALAGREPIPVTAFGVHPDQKRLDKLALLGVHRAVLFLPAGQRESVEPILDQYATLLNKD
jgi:probable F420-dependent oxidoreductase